MAAARPIASVVVPVRNGERHIRECVLSLTRTSYPAGLREIIVVDNGSSDRTAEIVRSLPVRYVYEARRGPSCARNRGILASSGSIVAFTDADCIVTTGWLSELVRAFDDERVWGAAGEIYSYPPRTPAQRYMALRKRQWQKPALESRWWPFAVTANVAFRRETFDRIGFFDPLLVRAQDKDFGRRFLQAGLRLEYCPKAVVFHQHRETAWGFFRQHAGWSYGAGLLHTKWRLPWSWRDELGKYAELARAAAVLVKTGLRHARYGGDRSELDHLRFEVLRRVAHRAGTLQWALSRTPHWERSGAAGLQPENEEANTR